MNGDKRELDILYQESPSHDGEEVSLTNLTIVTSYPSYGIKVTNSHILYVKLNECSNTHICIQSRTAEQVYWLNL